MTPQRIATVALLSILASACGSTDGNGGKNTGGSGGSAGSGGSGGSGASGGSGGAGGSGGGGSGGAVSPDSGPAGSGGAPPPDGGTGDGQAAAGDCTPAFPKSLFCDPLGKMPKSIKDLGIFPAAPDLSKHPASMLAYVPDPPLWSDGMEKQRFILLPAGKKIDNSNSKEWIFPVGTVFIKTFFDDTGPNGMPRPIETRFIRQVAEKGAAVPYEFFVYKWAPDSTDATLLVDDVAGDINKDETVNITIKHLVDGKNMVNGGMPFAHTLPSRQACGDCHEINGKVTQTFIGFDELRLNGNPDAAAKKTQLQQFFDAGIFSSPLPAKPATITDATPNDMGRMLRIKRFVFGNCVHCHNGNELVDFHPDVFIKNTVNQVVDAQSVVPPPGWRRVVPGKPEMSVVFVQTRRTPLPAPTGMDTKNRLRAMPPVGLADVAANKQAVDDLQSWIMAGAK